MLPKISVLVPVYNVVKYLPKCLKMFVVSRLALREKPLVFLRGVFVISKLIWRLPFWRERYRLFYLRSRDNLFLF